MNLRDIFVAAGCCAAAACLGVGKPARAGEQQSVNETTSPATGRCAPSHAPMEVTAGCERIEGHVRVEFGSRMPNPAGHGQPGASPIAVRLGEDASSPGHLRLPDREYGMDPFHR
ncbi:MAG: hypothetical protein ACT4O2_08325 [Beijerinckiaceae bacterium]